MKQPSQKALLVIWICSGVILMLDLIYDFNHMGFFWVAMPKFFLSLSTWVKGRKKNK